MNEDMLHPAVSSVPNSRLTCSQCERMVQDAVDGTLLVEDQQQFDLHLAGCPGCQRIYDDAIEGLGFLADLKSAPPEPSQFLMSRILESTSGNPQVALPIRRGETILVGLPRNDYPAGHLATVLPFQQQEKRKWPARMVHAAMQPRFAMTAAMAFFSVALTMNLIGVSPRDFHLSDLKPASLRHSFWGTRNRVVQYYDNLRIVYELESRVNEMQQRDADDDRRKSAAPKKEPDKPAPSGNGSHSKLQAPRHRDALRPIAILTRFSTLQWSSNAASAAGNRGEGAQV